MTKFILLIVLMFFVLAIAGVLMRRMLSISQKIADLQSDMKKSQVRLDAQMQVLEEQKRKEKLESNVEESSEIQEKNS